MKLLVTGATGFVGRAFCARMSDTADVVLRFTARSADHAGTPFGPVTPRDLGPDTPWRDLLDSMDVVVHTAARVHVMNGAVDAAEVRRVNVDGTLNLARQAAECGVRRFVFLSSVKVNGELTRPGQAFRADDRPAPVDAYAMSKFEAEKNLVRLADGNAMDIVVIRSPLVYGPGVKANFLNLMRWVHQGYPLPFARIHNRRSLIAVDNLVDLIRTCCRHPAAANQTFMAADAEDVSTAELTSRIGIALNRPARLVPVPAGLMLALATISGKRHQANSLLGNLQVDTGKTRELLDWTPVVDMHQALRATARRFLEESA